MVPGSLLRVALMWSGTARLMAAVAAVASLLLLEDLA
jgi:hypothetical protein